MCVVCKPMAERTGLRLTVALARVRVCTRRTETRRKGTVTRMDKPQVIVAGGGIGGLTLALTLHQIGVPCVVVETVRQMRPLGVGINIQPNAVRELFDLGIGPEVLDRVGVPAQEWALVVLNGKEVYAEPRGTFAGYRWPQYAAHRGALHMALYDAVVCLLYTSPSPRDRQKSRMPSSA